MACCFFIAIFSRKDKTFSGRSFCPLSCVCGSFVRWLVVSIGLGIGLIEQAAKTSWLEIVQGGMAGKQFILYKPTVSLGSAPTADVTLIKDPAIPAYAAEITRRAGAITLTSLDPARPVLVNGAAVTKTTLAEGSTIELGATVVRYRERSKKEVSASIVRR